MSNTLEVLVNQSALREEAEGQWADLKGTKRGEVCVIDFFTEMVLEGRGFHSHAGNKTTAITGDAAITSTASELSVGAAVNMAFIPFEASISIATQVGDAFECAGKSVGTTPAATTAFVPLPLYRGGPASRCVAFADTAGGATVAAETLLTTRTHFHYSEEFVGDTDAEENIAGILWTPRLYPVLPGASAFYLQVASTATAPTYFAHINWVEMPTANLT